MASKFAKAFSFFVVLFVVLLVAAPEAAEAHGGGHENNICYMKVKPWGYCWRSYKCNSYCTSHGHGKALYGKCSYGHCYCYYKCH
ncbi:hypothetical protein Sjap_010309 [Stephania japonica]|uniref:Uncharacterized protein n=1 Tax=Stephania japonica TaxID=461633 RepID=A0AAP0J8U8_9MAGN